MVLISPSVSMITECLEDIIGEGVFVSFPIPHVRIYSIKHSVLFYSIKF